MQRNRSCAVRALTSHAAIFAACLLSACAATDVPKIPAEGFRPEADEAQLWEQSNQLDARIEESGLIYRDAALQSLVDGVAERLIAAAEIPPETLRVRMLKDPLLNAFALPNGSVYVHAGLLARLDNEDQLATVLGHEFAHVIHRHGLRQHRSAANREAVATAVIAILAIAAAGAAGDPNAARVFGGLTGPVADIVITAQTRGYSRDLEREADAAGFAGMTAAGFDPREAPPVFSRLRQDKQEGRVVEPYYFASHPAIEERIANYEQHLHERGIGGAADTHPPRTSPTFSAATADLLLVTAGLDASLGRFGRAREALAKHLTHHPGSARGYFAIGELERQTGHTPDKLSAAVTAYERAVRLDATMPEAHRELGLIYRAQNRIADARVALQKYVALAPQAVDRPIVETYLRQLGASTEPGPPR